MDTQASFIVHHKSLLNEFVSLSKTIGLRPDYVQGGGGNTSVKLDDRHMAIKASGFKLSDIGLETAYAVLDYQGLREFYRSHEVSDLSDIEKAGADYTKNMILPMEGLPSLRPSVEAGFHSILDRFVIHSHSVYANLAACSTDGIEVIRQALAHASYQWVFVPYVDPGIRLTFSIRDEIRRIVADTGRRPAVIFLQNHGLIVHYDDPMVAMSIHSDVNARIAEAFGLRPDSFPQVRLLKLGENLFKSNTHLIGTCLRTKRYDQEFFLEKPLYPDQLVYLSDVFHVNGNTLTDGCCLADTNKGEVLYAMSEQKAQTIEETIAAVLFIAETIHTKGKTLSAMGEPAKEFIAHWESEKYRKSMSGSGGQHENP